MDITARSEGFFDRNLVEEAGALSRALLGRDHTLSLAGSTVLHVLAIALSVVLAPHYGTETAGKALGLVPIEVELDWNRASPAVKPSGKPASNSAAMNASRKRAVRAWVRIFWRRWRKTWVLDCVYCAKLRVSRRLPFLRWRWASALTQPSSA